MNRWGFLLILFNIDYIIGPHGALALRDVSPTGVYRGLYTVSSFEEQMEKDSLFLAALYHPNIGWKVVRGN